MTIVLLTGEALLDTIQWGELFVTSVQERSEQTMVQQNKMTRGTILLGSSLLGLVLLWLFLSSVSIAQATPPIEGNPVSMGRIPMASNPARAVTAADLDQNNRPDLAFGQNSSLQSMENTCEPVFDDTGVIVESLGSAKGMAIGDLDLDGHPDIVANSGYNMYAWKNDGTPFDGTWPQNYLGWYANIVPYALADFDDDGYLDILAANWCCEGDSYIEIWRNDGTPFEGQWIEDYVTFPLRIDTPALVSAMAVGDLDDNGTLEIVAGISSSSFTSTIQIWRFEGDPFVVTSWISSEVAVVTYTVHSIALGDLNNDDQLDIVFGTDHAPPADPMLDVYQLRAARSDGAPFDGGWTLFDLGRDPQWSGLTPAHEYYGANIFSVDVADFDNDGYQDVATGGGIEGDHQIMVWKNDGTPFDGQLWSPTATGLGEGTGGPWLWGTVYSVVAADFNGDGLMDLVSGSHSAEPYEINYWENSGIPFSELVTDTHWIRYEVGVLGVSALFVGAADFDSDSDMDAASLAEVASTNPTVHIWQNKTAGCATDVNLEADPSKIVADGTSTSLIEATVNDVYGNPAMNGTVVTFTTTLGSFPTAPYTMTTFSGVATATLTSSTTVGTAIVTATARATSSWITVTFEADSSSKVFLPVVTKEFGN